VTSERNGALSVRQIERTSAAEAVRAQLLALLHNGELAVGDKLPSEHELARSFGVSRPIIREALGALRAAGVVESRSGSGTYVKATQPTRPGLELLGRYAPEDLYEVRAHLEIPGAGLAAQRRTADQMRELEDIVARHATRTDPVEWIEDDLAFHILLAEASGNELQARLVREIRGLHQEMNIAVARITDLEAPLAEHTAILRAVERRDAEAAEAAMAAHLQAILDRTHAATDRRRG
jgi:DNA-binding FadR family transcriptional regulator